MSIKKLGLVVCGVLFSCLPQVGFAQSLQEKLNKVEMARTEFIGQMRGFQLYDKYIGKDPVTSLRDQDLAALNILIRSTQAEKLNLYCEATSDQIRSQGLKDNDMLCEDGVKYLRGVAQRPRVAFILNSRGQVLNITSAVRKSAHGNCTALETQQSGYVGAVANSNGREILTSFEADEAKQLETSRASLEQKLTMAVAVCCATQDSGEGNCLQRLEQTFNSLKK